MKTKLTLDQRKEALKKLKLRTRCNQCGEVGHWGGDPECSKVKARTSSRLTRFCDSYSLGACNRDQDHEGEEKTTPEMGYVPTLQDIEERD